MERFSYVQAQRKSFHDLFRTAHCIRVHYSIEFTEIPKYFITICGQSPKILYFEDFRAFFEIVFCIAIHDYGIFAKFIP
jgi:hypothetical protein